MKKEFCCKEMEYFVHLLVLNFALGAGQIFRILKTLNNRRSSGELISQSTGTRTDPALSVIALLQKLVSERPDCYYRREGCI